MSQNVSIRSVADIVFLVDATGSMSPCIEALKARITDFVTSLDTGNPVTWRAKVVGFRDIFVDGADWIVGLDHPFVTDVPGLTAQAARLEALGGGAGQQEVPESGLDALWEVMRLADWSTVGAAHRLVVVLTDAPAKEKMAPQTVGGSGQPDDVMAVAQKAAAEHFKLHIYAPPCKVWEMLGKVPRSDHFNVASGGAGDVWTGLSNLDWSKVIKMINATVSQPAAGVPVPAQTGGGSASQPGAATQGAPAPAPPTGSGPMEPAGPAPGGAGPAKTIKA